jgi:hypothetical protein
MGGIGSERAKTLSVTGNYAESRIDSPRLKLFLLTLYEDRLFTQVCQAPPPGLPSGSSQRQNLRHLQIQPALQSTPGLISPFFFAP